MSKAISNGVAWADVVTALELLNRIKTVDGDTSGLDADLLKGIDQFPGKLLKAALVEDTTFRSTTLIIPTDNSIPQDTEGTEWLSTSFTPVSPSSEIFIVVNAQADTSGADRLCIVTVFDGSGSSPRPAVAVGYSGDLGVTGGVTGNAAICLMCKVASFAGTRTFSARFGSDDGGTVYLNGHAAAQFGATPQSNMMILEIAA